MLTGTGCVLIIVSTYFLASSIARAIIENRREQTSYILTEERAIQTANSFVTRGTFKRDEFTTTSGISAPRIVQLV